MMSASFNSVGTKPMVSTAFSVGEAGQQDDGNIFWSVVLRQCSVDSRQSKKYIPLLVPDLEGVFEFLDV
jgi:hypothetical protein